MKIYILLLFSFTAQLMTATGQTSMSYSNYPIYTGSDLGVTYTPIKTTFKVWAPTAQALKLRLYKAGSGGAASRELMLKKSVHGTWQLTVNGNLKNQYYTFQTQVDGKWLLESPDLYASATGVNGLRGMVVDLPSTNPANWASDKRIGTRNPTDMLIYETHLRDISVSSNSGIKNKGKFLGLAENGTKTADFKSTGLDHIKELGATHIHILPAFDYNSIDENNPAGKYNWGYDPLNYNVPEGSYSTNPHDGNVRIKEFKQMVKAIHNKGMGVILDVVYNHTGDKDRTPFNQFVPGYYYRQNPDGSYSDGSACGNETASERAMMRKYMVDSFVYWAKEYHMDGFRVDLMGLHDIETMNTISDALHKIDPSIFIYGEGWLVGASPLPENQRAIKKHVPKLNRIAAFNDDMRDGLKGGFSDVKSKGFVSGAVGNVESVKFGIVGATQHPDVKYNLVNYSKEPWAPEPSQAINYVSCHDDPTLFDRLKMANPGAAEAELIKMDKLSNTVVLTSQGVPFLHSGAEMLRTKKGVGNSYNSPDSINELNWNWKTKYQEVYEYYRSLIALRKNHPAFRMPSADMIRKNLRFLETNDPVAIAYTISNNANGDKWKEILIVLNGNTAQKTISIPTGNWTLVGDGQRIYEAGIRTVNGGKVNIPETTAYILFR